MQNIFEIIDKRGKIIHLSKERWSHIRRMHPSVENWEDVEKTLLNPQRIVIDDEKNKAYFYSYFKHWKSPNKYLKVIVKYLNGEGFILSAYPIKDLR